MITIINKHIIKIYIWYSVGVSTGVGTVLVLFDFSTNFMAQNNKIKTVQLPHRDKRKCM